MLEKSVLNREDLQGELKKRYGFKEIENSFEVFKGNANLFRVRCDGKDYILKEYQSSYELKDIRKEEEISVILKEEGIPTAEIITCLNSESVWEFKERVFILQRFVHGVVMEANTGSYQNILESAHYLSKINLALQKIKLEKEDKISDWLTSESFVKTEQKCDKILEECEKNKNDPTFKKIKEDILLKKKLYEDIMKKEQVISSLTKVTSMNSHGDYSVLQFIYESDKSKIKAILDLSVAIKLPIVWEVIRSYTYIDPKCKDGEIDISTLLDYVKEYMKITKLSRVDLSMMPYVYLIQLLKSQYGYSEYVLKRSENKEQLLEFAFWRTKMCRWLAANAEKLSKELSILDY